VIILSGVLVVLAIALLVVGIVLGETGGRIADLADGMTVIYLSIAVSIVSFLCLLVGVVLRRKELFGAVATGAQGRRRGREPVRAKPAAARSEAAEDTTIEPIPAPDVPAGAVVYVIPGRRRYHLATCRQLSARDKQELTYEEAREEGFSACTACLPDTALAARAATEDPAGVAAADSVGADGRSGFAELDEPAEYASSEAAMADGVDGAGETAGIYSVPGYQSGEPDETYAAGGSGEPVHHGDSQSVPAQSGQGGPDALTESPYDYERRRPGRHAAGFASGSYVADATGGHHRSAGAASEVLVLAGTRRYHRPDCALIEDIATEQDADDLETLSATAAEAKGYTACLVCRPEKEPARD
jgi:hypothetical protein